MMYEHILDGSCTRSDTPNSLSLQGNFVRPSRCMEDFTFKIKNSRDVRIHRLLKILQVCWPPFSSVRSDNRVCRLDTRVELHILPDIDLLSFSLAIVLQPSGHELLPVPCSSFPTSGLNHASSQAQLSHSIWGINPA